MRRTIATAILLVLGATAALADIAPPPGKSQNRVKKPTEAPPSTLVIRLDRKEKEAKLLIPRSQIAQLRAQLDQLDSDPTAATASGVSSIGSIQTIVSGSLLSLAIVFGGFWFARSGIRTASGKGAVAGMIAVVALASAATITFANVGPPPEARSITSKLFDQKIFTPYRSASGDIRVAVKGDGGGNHFELVVPDLSTPPTAGE